jgi:hypothetical protein
MIALTGEISCNTARAGSILVYLENTYNVPGEEALLIILLNLRGNKIFYV